MPLLAASSESPADAAERAAADGDFATAIESWRQALESTQESKRTHDLRLDWINSIVNAAEQAEDDKLLAVAYDVLTAYQDELGQAYGEAASDTPGMQFAGEEARTLRARLQQQEPRMTDADDQQGARDLPVPAKDKSGDKGRALLIGGSVSAAVGVVALGVMGGGIALWQQAQDDWEAGQGRQQDLENQIKRRSGLAWGMGIIGVAALATGAALVAIAIKRGARSERARASSRPTGTGMEVRF